MTNHVKIYLLYKCIFCKRKLINFHISHVNWVPVWKIFYFLKHLFSIMACSVSVENLLFHIIGHFCLFKVTIWVMVIVMVFNATFNNIQLYRGGQFYWWLPYGGTYHSTLIWNRVIYCRAEKTISSIKTSNRMWMSKWVWRKIQFHSNLGTN